MCGGGPLRGAGAQLVAQLCPLVPRELVARLRSAMRMHDGLTNLCAQPLAVRVWRPLGPCQRGRARKTACEDCCHQAHVHGLHRLLTRQAHALFTASL